MPKPKRKRKFEPDIIAFVEPTASELYEAAVIHQALQACGRGQLFLAPPDDGPLILDPDDAED